MKRIAPLLFLCSLLPTVVLADEAAEVKRLAPKYGVTAENIEFRLWDGCRVDLLSPTHAIEVDYAKKWAEACGQALYYATLTRRKPGIILLVDDRDRQARLIYRCQTVCARVGIDLWLEPKAEKKVMSDE